jgi:uncharacterized protein (DUF1330 family)
MPAYMIADIRVTDPVRYEEYKRLAAPSVAAYGGRYIVRGGPAEKLEGEGEISRIVVLEFPSIEQARVWWSSAEYAPAKALRHECATAEMLLVEGM